jgi:hypothetical protein
MHSTIQIRIQHFTIKEQVYYTAEVAIQFPHQQTITKNPPFTLNRNAQEVSHKTRN